MSNRQVASQGGDSGSTGSAGSHELGPGPENRALCGLFPGGLVNVTVPPAAIVAVVDDVPVTYQ